MVLPGSTGGGGAINMAAGAINMNGGLVGGVPQLTGGGPINMNGGNINMVGTAAATTGGGVFNLQGGEIEDTSTAPAININTGAIPLDNGGTPPKPTALVTVGTDCSVDGVSGLGTGAADSNCAPGIQVQGDQVVLGRLNANSLYAQTFIYNSSDMRLKTDIHTMKDPLESVMKLNPVDFKFKATGQEGLGVIAQDVEKIYPQLVSMRGDGMKAVNYEGLIAPLIGAVQELKKENDDLRQQVRDQAIRQDELERQLKSKSTSR